MLSRFRTCVVSLVVTLSVAASGCATAHTSSTSAPSSGDVRAAESVARDFVHATVAGQWDAAARDVDLDRMEQVRQADLAMARRSAERRQHHPVVTVEQLMRQDSTMPRSVAEYQVRKFTESFTNPPNEIEREFAGVSDPDSLERLTPLEATARWLEAHDPRYRTQRMLAASRARGCKAPMEVPGPAQRLHRVVGAVVEDSLAYVVVRESPDSAMLATIHQRFARAGMPDAQIRSMLAETPTPLTLQLRRTSDGWRILPPTSGILNGADAIVMGVVCIPDSASARAHS